ncbi:MAG: signal peptidase II [Dehalococcoidia bacterium]|jgi:signal peptidase II|nr:signal peptidase II [Dehalococcoidia bacterium]MDP6782876.1 signal peptidase II [Dehalococcoidia bacterium]
MNRELAFFIPALGVVVADQLTKLWVRSFIPMGNSVPILGPVRFTHVANSGAVFGLPAHPLVLIGLIVIIMAVLVLSYRQSYFDGWLLRPVLGTLLGGGVGNLIDRLRLGYVTDFVDLQIWPVFNLADSIIVVGTATLIYSLISRRK